MKSNNNKDKIKIIRADIPHNINADDVVTKTDLGRYSKIVKTNVNNKPSPIKKLSKYEYLDTRDNKRKQYDLDKPVSTKDIKKKLKKYEELVLYNFAGGRSELFVTLTCSENVQNLEIIKQYFKEFTDNLAFELRKNGIRYEVDYREEKLGYKIREAQVKKIPYQLVIGDNEMKNNTVTYREYGKQEQITVSITDFINMILDKNKNLK